MISVNQLKYYSSLRNKKYRNEENKFIVEGKKIILEGINSNYNCEVIFVTKVFIENNKEFLSKINSKSIRIEVIKSQDFKKFSDTITPQGIAAVFQKGNKSKTNLFKTNLVVYLDDISEPGNLGTIIRNCDWFGVQEIILSPDCAELYNPKTIRASMGSMFHLNIFENIDLKSYLNVLKEKKYLILCSDIQGADIFNYNKASKKVIIFSNEAKGPNKEMINLSDEIITIPKLGKAESLNVASASAIILAELTYSNKKA